MHKRSFRIARSVLVLALAVGGYLWLVPLSRPDPKLVPQLLIEHSRGPGVPTKPSLSEQVPASRSTFAVVRRAAKENPGRTVLYERAWSASSPAPPEAGLLLQFLPDDSSARAAFADSLKQLEKAPQLNSETAGAPEKFKVPGVPGASGVSHSLTDDTTKKVAGYAYSVDFRVGRAVVSELMVTVVPERSTKAVIEDSRSEHDLLARKEPGFNLSPTRLPVVASVVYVVLALAVVGLAFSGPELAVSWWARRRQRREAKERERVLSEYRARGRRAVRRHRAPAWRQGARR